MKHHAGLRRLVAVATATEPTAEAPPRWPAPRALVATLPETVATAEAGRLMTVARANWPRYCF